jgi:hypothetical protein
MVRKQTPPPPGKLTPDDVAALAWALRNYSGCFPPEKRNVTKNGPFQEAFDKLRLARGALRKVRALQRKGM